MNRWVWGILLCAALALRLALIGSAEYWYDESFTILLSRLEIPEMLKATAGDTHPPAYYLLIWAWARLGGEGESWIRLSSVICSMLSVPVLWLVLERLGVSRAAQVVTTWFFALNPFQLYFAQEARMYALLELLVLCGVLAALSNRYGWLGLINLLLLYTHNYGLFYVAALGGLVLYRREWRLWNLALDFGLPGLAFQPWVMVLISQMRTVATGYWIEPVTLGQVMLTTTIEFFGAFSRQYIMAGTLVVVGIFAWSMVRNLHNRPAWLVPVAWLALAPFAMSIMVSLLWKPIYLYRGLIGCTPFLYLLVVEPATRLTGWRRVYLAGLVAPVLAAGLVGFYQDIIQFKSTTLDAVDWVMERWQPGDIIYSINDGTWVSWSAYVTDRPIYLMPECPGQHDRGALSPLTREALGVPIAELDELEFKRAWVLWHNGATAHPCNIRKAEALLAGYEPLLIAEDSAFVFSGIWMIDETLESSQAQ